MTIKTLMRLALLSSVLTLTGAATSAQAAEAKAKSQAQAGDRQLLVWTSADREVALRMVLMYAQNAQLNGWMEEVQLLVWGPSQKLLCEDKELQERVQALKATGVEVFACKACADQLGLSDKLTSLGVKVMFTGTMLANAQKNGWHVLTF
jgi:hypothetical protein